MQVNKTLEVSNSLKIIQVQPWLGLNVQDMMDISDFMSDSDGSHFDFANFEALLYAKENCYLYLAIDAADGYIGMLTAVDRGNGIALIQQLHVVESRRGQQIGEMITKEFFKDFPRAFLGVGASNAGAIRFYSRLGFENVCEFPNFYDIWEFADPAIATELHCYADGFLLANYDTQALGFGKSSKWEVIPEVSPEECGVAVRVSYPVAEMTSQQALAFAIFTEECGDDHYGFDNLEDLALARATMHWYEIGPSIVAYASFIKRSKSIYCLDSLHVLPELRGRRFGKRLLESFHHNDKRMFAVVGKNNEAALKFYRIMGYRPLQGVVLPGYFSNWELKSKDDCYERQLYGDGVIVSNYSISRHGMGESVEVI